MRKRLVTTLLVCLAAIIAAFGFAACKDEDDGNGKDNGETKITEVKGKSYKCTECSVAGTEDDEAESIIYSQYYLGEVFIFNEDKTVYVSFLSDDLEDYFDYTQNGKKVSVVGDGEDNYIYNGEVAGDTLTLCNVVFDEEEEVERLRLNLTLKQISKEEADAILEELFLIEGTTFKCYDCWIDRDAEFTREELMEIYRDKTITFNSDGTVTSDIFPDGMTYTQDGEKIAYSFGGDTFEGSYSRPSEVTFVQKEGDVTVTFYFIWVTE